ncbi:MAG TPA: DUF3857 domain-containing protein, partial [Candidatus Coatesbacteria bacterium]|nr:DUF3857 domain-containing protein [Candidatus Coatesbacteria bacterium]
GLYYLGHLEARERRARIDERLHRELFNRAFTGSRAFGGPDSTRPWAPAAHSYALYETAFNPAKNAWLEALEADPRHVESLLGLARSYAQLQRPREVLAYAASGLEENPACLPLLIEKARQLALLEYQIERKAVLDKIFELHPGYRSAEEELAAYGRDRADILERARLYESILERDAADGGALGRLTDLYLELGRSDEARRLLESGRPLEPCSLWSFEKEARLLFDRGDYSAAARVLSRALELCPEEAELLGLYGCALYELGLRDEAEAAWDRALDIQPNLTWVTDYRRSLAVGTASDNFDEPYAHDVYALIDAFEPLDPDASAEVLLNSEIVKVNSDGTVSRVVHKVVMLKTEDALADFGWGYFSYVPGAETYEVRHFRVIRADSTELEATDFREYSTSDPEARMYTGSVTRYAPMPGLEPGAVIDISYQIDEVGENIFQGHFSRTFVFGGYQPVHLAEFILIAPTGYRLYYKGSGGAVPPVVTENGRERALRWTLRDIPRIKPEPSAPPPIENLPYVAVSSFADWRELGRWWWQLAKETLLDTPLIRELAARLVSEAGARTTLEKIAAGYDYVTKSLRYVAILLGIGGWKPIEPESTVHTGYGDCKAGAALLVSLYRAMGIRAYPVLVRTRDRGRVEWDQAGLGLFNHMICAVPF